MVEETNRYAMQFLCRHKLSGRSTAGALKPVTGRNLCCSGSRYVHGDCSRTESEIIFYTKKRVISTAGFGHFTTRYGVKLYEHFCSL